MASKFLYSIIVVVFLATLGLTEATTTQATTTTAPEEDPCNKLSDTTCEECITKGGNATYTCGWMLLAEQLSCAHMPVQSQFIVSFTKDAALCHAPTPNTTTTAPPPTTTNGTTTTTTTTTTTVAPPTTTNGTTTTTVPTTTKPTDKTTTTEIPTTTTPASNVTTITMAPTNSSTTAIPVTPSPHGGGGGSGFQWGTFFGGVVFMLALGVLGMFIFRFYKTRLERNYHTFTNPSTF